jgi:hypothetical protein
MSTLGNASDNKAWVVSVDMGYGHQRAAYPLKDIARERIITANSDRIISRREIKTWAASQDTYELVSRIKSIPFVGKTIFNVYDRLQTISPFYPFRDLSKPNFSVLYVKSRIQGGFCRSLIDYVSTEPLPFIATHFIPALAAYYLGLKQVYCVVTDTDINRIWVPDDPAQSEITYLAPCRHVVTRLKQYGVPSERIVQTGFPLPKENLGGRDLVILKQDLADRLPNLDPNGEFRERFGDHVEHRLAPYAVKSKSSHPLTITFAVGGAGAQTEIGIAIVQALRERILKGEINVNLAAGTRLEVMGFFRKELVKLGLEPKVGGGVRVIFALDKGTYFQRFNQALRTTDILWTKPSEISFYTALGLPVISAPPIGAQEISNREWLEHIGSGFLQEDLRYLSDWFFYILASGRFAEAAWQGFLEAPNLGTYHIEDLVLYGKLPNDHPSFSLPKGT